MTNEERNVIVSNKLKEKLSEWIEDSKSKKINIFINPLDVLKKAKEPFFSDGDCKPYWFSYTYHREMPKEDEIVFGIEISSGLLSTDNYLFTTSGFHYLKGVPGKRTDKKGNVESITHYIPERLEFWEIAQYGAITAKKKFFGGDSDSKSDIQFSSDFKIEGVKNEIAAYFEEIIGLIKNELLEYESNLSMTKENLTIEMTQTITSASGFDEFLSNNEEKIASIEVKHLHSFVKLASFLQTKESSISKQTNYIINSSYELQELPDLKEKISSQINLYNSMYLLSINMVVALLEGKSIMFFKIYELFDRQGVFNSEWQKGITNILVDIDSNIKEVVNRIDFLETSLSSEIRLLESSISDKLLDMQGSVENSLGNLNGKIGYSNLISTINLVKK
jgi:hypothetical protein